MLIVFVLVAAATVLFILERIPVGMVAAMVMATLMLTRVLTVPEGLSGFSSRATITIGAMFMLSEGVRRTGALDIAASLLSRSGKDRSVRALLTMMLIVGGTSALINNTAAIAVFIPVAMAAATRMETSPSKLLMPISFASMLGGVCTLIGTSTNILVSEIAEENGMEPISMFELTPVGLVFMGIGLVFLLTVGRRLVPARRSSEPMRGYDLKRYIADFRIKENSPLVGRPLGEDGDLNGREVEVVSVFRDGRELKGRITDMEPHAGDVLRILGSVERVDQVMKRRGLELSGNPGYSETDLEETDHILLEVVVAPDSPLVRQKVRYIEFPERFGAFLLAIRHRESMYHKGFRDLRLRAGDCLLLAVDSDQVEDLQMDPAIVPVSRVPRTRYRHSRMPVALAVMGGVVLAAALDWAPITVSALVGVIVMVLSGCLKMEEGLKSVHWEVIILLAGMIPLGLAMDKTGAARLIAGAVTEALGTWGPQAVLSGILLLSMGLTAIMNNQASAVMLGPIVIEMARSMSVDPRTFLIAVTYGASLSFITPIGYQTNTMIYEPGQYRFTDFFKVGIGLNLLLWAAGSFLIPMMWPLVV